MALSARGLFRAWLGVACLLGGCDPVLMPSGAYTPDSSTPPPKMPTGPFTPDAGSGTPDGATPPPVTGACGAITYLGECQGAVAVWCENGALASRNCADSGQSCAYIDENIGHYCVAGTPPPPLGDGGVADSGGGATCWSEEIRPDADISSLTSAYGGGDYKQDIIRIIETRWPGGGKLLADMTWDAQFDGFCDPSSWSGMIQRLPTLYHEMTHGFNHYTPQNMGMSGAKTYYFNASYFPIVPASLEGFPRHEIASMLPASTRASTYVGTYLTPGTTEGDRGFTDVIDEMNCYTNEVVVMSMVGESFGGGGTSIRDGALAWTVFLETYLKRARTSYPDFYAQAQANDVVRGIVRDHWLRLHFFLEYSDRYPEQQTFNADAIRAEMHAPENMQEISMFIGADVSDSACLR